MRTVVLFLNWDIAPNLIPRLTKFSERLGEAIAPIAPLDPPLGTRIPRQEQTLGAGVRR